MLASVVIDPVGRKLGLERGLDPGALSFPAGHGNLPVGEQVGAVFQQ